MHATPLTDCRRFADSIWLRSDACTHAVCTFWRHNRPTCESRGALVTDDVAPQILSETELDGGYTDEGGDDATWTVAERQKIKELLQRYEQEQARSKDDDDDAGGEGDAKDAEVADGGPSHMQRDLLSERFRRVIAPAPGQCVRVHSKTPKALGFIGSFMAFKRPAPTREQGHVERTAGQDFAQAYEG